MEDVSIIKLEELKSHLHKILKHNILDYWSTFTIDQNNGGFIGFIDSHNKKYPEATKGIILNARILWTFSSVYGFYKKEIYKDLANRAYDYLLTYFNDPLYKGVFWELDFHGNPVNRRKQIYAQSFAIYALSEYFKITSSQEVLNRAIEIYKLVEKYSFDRERNGYIEAFKEDWSGIKDFRLSEKDLNAPKTMNTHLHILEAYTNLYRIWKDNSLFVSLKNLVELFFEKFVDDTGHLILFFDFDWNALENVISYGHDIEFTWLLTEATEVLGDNRLLYKTRELAVRMAKIILNEATDNYGGILSEYDRDKQILDSEKHWWPQAEAMVGFLNAYQISGEKLFMEAMISIWEFINGHIIDHKNGEWFWKVNREGEVIEGMEKVGFWKGPYHNSRALIEVLNRMDLIQDK